jgi:hypothetical protein
MSRCEKLLSLLVKAVEVPFPPIAERHIYMIDLGTTPRAGQIVGVLGFDHYKDLWWVCFIEADCRTLIGPKTRYAL